MLLILGFFAFTSCLLLAWSGLSYILLDRSNAVATEEYRDHCSVQAYRVKQ